MSWWFEWERLLASINALTVFLKYFKLLRVSDRLSMLIRCQTLSDVAGLVYHCWFFLGYAFMGYILFVPHSEGFQLWAAAS